MYPNHSTTRNSGATPQSTDTEAEGFANLLRNSENPLTSKLDSNYLNAINNIINSNNSSANDNKNKDDKINNSKINNLPNDLKFSNLIRNEINFLILNYLIFENYENATKLFAKELNLDFIVDELDKIKEDGAEIIPDNDHDDTDNDNDNDNYNENYNNDNDDLMSISTNATRSTNFQNMSITQSENDEELYNVDEFFTSDKINSNINKQYEYYLSKNLNSSYISNLSIDKFKRIIFGLNTIKLRNKIKINILNGNIDESINLINSNFPNLFEKNQFIYFKLNHLKLIEMIRNHFMNNNENDEKLFLKKLLLFIKNKLSTSKILQNESFIKELELTMTLLCFGNQLISSNNSTTTATHTKKFKLPFKLKHLLNLKLRKEIADLVNKSILINLNNDQNLNNINSLLLNYNYYANKKITSTVPLDLRRSNNSNHNNNNNGTGINSTIGSSNSNRNLASGVNSLHALLSTNSLFSDATTNNNDSDSAGSFETSMDTENDKSFQLSGINSKDELENKFKQISNVKLKSLIRLMIWTFTIGSNNYLQNNTKFLNKKIQPGSLEEFELVFNNLLK
ncbi:unnamed protein product [[Candida] boidinii]|nr:hypothetical protein BVG19_g294 [[Candida] boidinii]OWB52567.1 transferase activity protein [[Candida] boidinii]OWB85615.1 transferase activity protein [[Candida] boidinii]GMF01589.1 unnamed protein product [[Candida] boidinii]